MGKFNSYAKKVNEIATAAFEEYRKAEKAYKAAEEKQRMYPHRNGMVDAQYAAKSARAQADFLEAKEALSDAKSALLNHRSEIAALRRELAAELDDTYAADPAKLDVLTLELLKSGILKPHEYKKLMDTATNSSNHTMARVIAQFAGAAAEQRGSKYGQYDKQVQELRAISNIGDQNNGSDALDAFDVMAEVYNRTSNNPAMISSWDELTSRSAEIL